MAMTENIKTKPKDLSLTPRYLDVLHWASLGFSVEETAKILFISEDTVKTHRKHAISRLNAENMIHAVAISIRKGYIK